MRKWTASADMSVQRGLLKLHHEKHKHGMDERHSVALNFVLLGLASRKFGSQAFLRASSIEIAFIHQVAFQLFTASRSTQSHSNTHTSPAVPDPPSPLPAH